MTNIAISFSYILPDEILLIIFDLCDVYTLSQISIVCKQFYRISQEILIKKTNHLLITNQMSKKFCERCKPLLSSYISKFITHYNWTHGLYRRREIYKKVEPKFSYYGKYLQMTKNMIFFYEYDHLFAYNRAKDGTLEKNKIVGNCNSYIRDMIYCNGVIITSHNNGSIEYWRIKSGNKENYLQQFKIHYNVVRGTPNDIDATSQYIITSGSLQLGTIKILKNTHEEDDGVEENTISYDKVKIDVIQKISIDPTERKVALGGCKNSSADNPMSAMFLLYDIDKRCPIIEKINSNRQYCRGMLWEDPHTILICNRHCIKKMDTRTSEFVRTWDAPFLNPEWDTLTCLSSDNLYTITTGKYLNDEVILWDQRQSASVQTYNMCRLSMDLHKKKCDFNNRVYSVQFDSTNMYAVTKENLIELNFKARDRSNYKDLKECFKKFF